LLNWLSETFPPKEFMLRSNSGMKYFKIGTYMQVIIISLLITSGSLVALFTYKMQFLQTVNYKQNLALKDLRIRYTKFTDAVVNLRDELRIKESSFADTDLDVELQVKKVTSLLDLLKTDLAAINNNNNIKDDDRLIDIKNKLESIIQEKQDRQKMLLELDDIIDTLETNIDKVYKISNEEFYIDSDFTTVYYNKEDKNIVKEKGINLDLVSSKKELKNLGRTIQASVNATTELKMLSYDLAMKKEAGVFFEEQNTAVKVATLKVLEENISFLEKIFKDTRSFSILKTEEEIVENALGGPFEPLDEEDEIASEIFDRSKRFELLRSKFLSVPLSAPINSYYVTSSFGFRKDPYTKRRAFHKGIDLGAPWGSDIVATAPGKVSFVGRYGSYGKSVFVNHGHGIETRYAHLSKITVQEGEEVELGMPIGKIGNTGRSTGKHLHYEIKINNKAKNPRPFLRIGKNVSKK